MFGRKYAKHSPSLTWPQLQVENHCRSRGIQQKLWNCPWIQHFRIHGEKMMQPATCPFSDGCGWQQSVYPCNATNWRTRVGYYITEQVLLRTYANFCLFPFLQKLINVLKAVFSFWFIGIKGWIRCNLHYTSDQKALLFLLILSTFSVLFFSF